MKNTLYEEMYQHYKRGLSLQEVARMYGMTRQSVYEGFKRRGLKSRQKKQLPFLTYDGIKFTLRNHGYYSRTDGDRELMHRYIWIKERGEIPEGYEVHHINHSKVDNRIDNFELLTKSEHAKKYNSGHNQFKK